ncbi:HERV-H LTR-associating protein 2 [Salminus brasiliensis]|uniref:HERV-H LTR-associating protein 2 n=1 Tax=Salminus brasiliensis TaxID=930266 RepID=UPI003B8335C8
MLLCDILNRSVSCTLIWVYSLLWILSFVQSKIPDVHVTCIYSEDCILPCSFPSSDDKVLIQWYQQEELIYSFQEDEAEPDDSSISLFTDEVSNGNASLLLKDSRTKNRGRYKCTVKTSKTVEESYVIVKVEAPISRISIETNPTGYVQCSTHGVFPAPVLTWSTEPQVSSLQPVTRMSADSDGLYSVDSTLKKQSSPLTYICTIISKYSSQTWKASLLQTEIAGKDGQDLIIPCVAPKKMKNFNLTWTFAKTGKNKDILTYNSQTRTIVNHWDSDAEVELDKAQMGDGSLYLDDLEGSKYSGNYTCMFSGPQVKYTVQTSVNIDSSQAVAQTGKSKSNLWVLAVVVAGVALLGVLYYIYRKYRGKSKTSKNSGQDTEMQAVNQDKRAEETPAEDRPLNTKEDS